MSAFKSLLLLSATCAGLVRGADVFLFTGQSNAKIELAQGIEDTLRASGHFPDLKILWTNHSGQALNRWYNNGPGPIYAADFYSLDGSGTGLVENAMNEGGGGRLVAPAIHNEGTLVLRNQAALDVTGDFINLGTLDTSNWNGDLPARFTNNGTCIQRSAPRVEATCVTEGRFLIDMQGWAGHRYHLEHWSPQGGTWSPLGDEIHGDGSAIQFSVPLEGQSAIFRVGEAAVAP